MPRVTLGPGNPIIPEFHLWTQDRRLPSPQGPKPGQGRRPGKPSSANHYSPAENQGLRQPANLKRIRYGPVFTQEQTEAFRAVATYGTDESGMLPRQC